MLITQDPNYPSEGGLRTIGDESVGLTKLANPLPNQVVMGQGERLIVTTVALTAARTLALPPAASFGAGVQLKVVDAHRGASSTHTITLTLNGSDTYDGAGTAPVINAAGGKLNIVSDGISNWQDA